MLLPLQMSTEIAKSFTSKDLAETFPRHIASLQYMYVTAPDDMSADAVKSGRAAVPAVQVHSEPTRITAQKVESIAELAPIGLRLDSDYSISYSGIFITAGLVFGDPLPYNIPSDGIGFLDKKDLVGRTSSQTDIFKLDIYVESSFFLNIQEMDLQFSSENIFPTAEPFFV